MAESNHDTEIIEGFLCPICKADLKSFPRLKTHFQENHPEDQDVVKSLKGNLQINQSPLQFKFIHPIYQVYSKKQRKKY